MTKGIGKRRLTIGMLSVGCGLSSLGYGLVGISYNAAYWRSLGPDVVQSGTSSMGFAILAYIVGPLFIGIGTHMLWNNSVKS